jgi:RimJ/RimL family protein N-acetyltransferase
MRHSLQGEGFAVRLRPVELDDAPFIVWLRNSEHAKGKIGDSVSDIAAQEEWLRIYFERPDDYYFIIETEHGVPVGTYGFYNFEGTTAETGRWVIRTGVPAAGPSILVALDLAFVTLRLSAVRARTVSTNATVLSIHRKIGFQRTGIEPGGQLIGGKAVDLVLSVLLAEDAPKTRARLLAMARWSAEKVLAWESGHLQEIRSSPGLSNRPWLLAAAPAA